MQGTDRYGRVEQALAAIGAVVGAAEAQGLLCGMLSAPGKAGKAEWIAQVLADTSPSGDAAKACLEALVAVYERTEKQLDNLDMDLELLLPSDTVPVAERAQALGRWCEGFLVGVGLGGLKQSTPLAADVAEALRDLGNISRVEVEAAEGEENEEAYAELVEFVRVAAMLVRSSLHEKPAPKPPAGKHLH